MGISVRENDEIAVQIWGNSVMRARATVNIRRKDSDLAQNVLAPVNDVDGDRTRTEQLTRIGINGEVGSIAVDALDPTPPSGPGQIYVAVILLRDGIAFAQPVGDYLYTGNWPSWPGKQISPIEGVGWLRWVQEANDAAGNVVTTVNLAATNARRIVRGIIVKYHQVGGADATITITMRDLADGGGPTNWSIASDTWVSPSLVLGAGQEGLIHVGEHGFLSTNDAGTIAYADNTTAPNPFPMLVDDGDTVDLLIAASGGASGDDYDVWVQYEEWIEV